MTVCSSQCGVTASCHGSDGWVDALPPAAFAVVKADCSTQRQSMEYPHQWPMEEEPLARLSLQAGRCRRAGGLLPWMCVQPCARVWGKKGEGACCLSCNKKLTVQIGYAAHRQQSRQCTPTQSHLLGIGTAGIGGQGGFDSRTHQLGLSSREFRLIINFLIVTTRR
jgi:hypothetical protein